MKRNYEKGQKFGRWTIQECLGGGGNGQVWKCTDNAGNTAAIKLLKSIRPKAYARFKDETHIIEQNGDIPGIMPMIEKFLPPDLEKEVPYYLMPVAKSAENTLKGKSIEQKVDAMLQVAETLKELHKRGISHRDLKPPNLLLYNERYCIADFGLVDYPDKADVSQKDEEIGPKWTMAPEMRRESSNADGKKADIYSLAKTLWIFLTEIPKGFDGQYSANSILKLREKYSKTYTTPLDTLLTSCTDNDPDQRPTIDKFIGALEKWKILNEDFHERNIEQWFEIQTQLFPTAFPKRVVWENLDDIIKILKTICSYDDLNHVFFPNGGGLDLEDVRKSHEKGCLELDCQLPEIVKPRRLVFESFSDDPEWNYFRLELADLTPSGVKDAVHRGHEALSEINPGQYADYNMVEYRYENIEMGHEIPDSARHITRWLEGALVIFNKRSPYNLEPATYDGRHNKMTTDQFREYIEGSIPFHKRTGRLLPFNQ